MFKHYVGILFLFPLFALSGCGGGGGGGGNSTSAGAQSAVSYDPVPQPTPTVSRGDFVSVVTDRAIYYVGDTITVHVTGPSRTDFVIETSAASGATGRYNGMTDENGERTLAISVDSAVDDDVSLRVVFSTGQTAETGFLIAVYEYDPGTGTDDPDTTDTGSGNDGSGNDGSGNDGSGNDGSGNDGSDDYGDDNGDDNYGDDEYGDDGYGDDNGDNDNGDDGYGDDDSAGDSDDDSGSDDSGDDEDKRALHQTGRRAGEAHRERSAAPR